MKLAIRRIIKNWLKEHDQVKNVFKKHARTNKCATMEGLIKETRLSESEIEKHCMILKLHGYFIAPLPGTFCSKSAIKNIYGQF